MDPMSLAMLAAVVAAFYFLMIRPQQKRKKEQTEKIASLEVGARVMTVHGIFGTIVHLGEKQVILEISPGVEMTLVKQAISTQPVEEEFEYENEEASFGKISEPSDAELAELLSSEDAFKASETDETDSAVEQTSDDSDSDEAVSEDK
ncbi:MAG: preprotein translocase subunit YajC [Propionibacteriaceae bacterium]|nr:preprotein translocase subunit YajC [Propionibacteriaceae bacterium]